MWVWNALYKQQNIMQYINNSSYIFQYSVYLLRIQYI